MLRPVVKKVMVSYSLLIGVKEMPESESVTISGSRTQSIIPTKHSVTGHRPRYPPQSHLKVPKEVLWETTARKSVNLQK